jgi:hypothetical protein
MCEKCDDLDERILKFQRFIAQAFDSLTKERLLAGVEELLAEKAGLHPEEE